MFGDFIKIAARTIAITAGVLVIIGLVSQITVPSFDTSLIVDAIGHGKAILSYYVPDIQPLLVLGFSLISLRFVGVPLARVGLIVYRIILNVNH